VAAVTDQRLRTPGRTRRRTTTERAVGASESAL